MSLLTLPLQQRSLLAPGAVPTPADFMVEGVATPGILVLNPADGRGWTYNPVTEAIDLQWDRGVTNALLIPALAGETGVLNPAYEHGDCRRYGIWPDGVTNWEGIYPARTTAFMRACTLSGVRGYMPPGLYYTGLNWSTADYDGARCFFDNATIGGIFHIQSSALPMAGDPLLYDYRFSGTLGIADRLGVANVGKVIFDRIRLVSDPAKNSSYPDSKGRGVHITTLATAIEASEIIIEGCEAGHNTDAAFCVDGGGGANPSGIRVGRLLIEDSDVHGVYLTGGGHRIEEIEVRGYSAQQNQNAMQDSDGLAQSQEGCGAWLNRLWDSWIGEIIVDQPAGRANGFYDIRIDETDLNGPRGLRIERMKAKSVRARGICIGDRNYFAGGAAQLNVSIGSVEWALAPGATLATGYRGFEVNNRAGGTQVTVDGDISVINPGVATGVYVGPAASLTVGGRIRYLARGFEARGTALEVAAGFIMVPNGIDYKFFGGSLATATGVMIDGPMTGSYVGPVTATTTSLNTKTLASISNGNGFEIGPISGNRFRSASGTIILGTNTDTTVKLGPLASGGGTVTGTIGLRVTGALTDVRIVGAKITGFETGLAKNAGATFTRVTAINSVSSGNTVAQSTLAPADLTQIGACAGLTT